MNCSKDWQKLASGGFVIEALPPVIEAVSLALKSYFVLMAEPHEEGEQLYKRMQNHSEEISEQEATAFLSAADSFIEICVKEITKYTLT
jgi:vacuolar-type H+-ATPase subunit E/Vma4